MQISENLKGWLIGCKTGTTTLYSYKDHVDRLRQAERERGVALEALKEEIQYVNDLRGQFAMGERGNDTIEGALEQARQRIAGRERGDRD